MAGLKKHLEYLFFVWDPTLPGGGTEMARIPDEGFRDAETYRVRTKMVYVVIPVILFMVFIVKPEVQKGKFNTKIVFSTFSIKWKSVPSHPFNYPCSTILKQSRKNKTRKHVHILCMQKCRDSFNPCYFINATD